MTSTPGTDPAPIYTPIGEVSALYQAVIPEALASLAEGAASARGSCPRLLAGPALGHDGSLPYSTPRLTDDWAQAYADPANLASGLGKPEVRCLA